MPSIRSRLVFGAGFLLALGVAPAYADKCTGAKLKALAKKASGLLGCHAKVAAKGDPSLFDPCRQKVETKYGTAFAKAGSCGGDQALCECLAENCATLVRAALPDNGKCEATRLKAAGKKASGKLACNSKAAAKGLTVDSMCIQKLEAKYQAAFAKATGCTGDQNAVETTVNQSCVSDLGADPTGGGTVGAICASCTAVTTTTTNTTAAGASTTTSTMPPTVCCNVSIDEYTIIFPTFVGNITNGCFMDNDQTLCATLRGLSNFNDCEQLDSTTQACATGTVHTGVCDGATGRCDPTILGSGACCDAATFGTITTCLEGPDTPVNSNACSGNAGTYSVGKRCLPTDVPGNTACQ
jgi:hypothetical protein